MRPVAAAVGVVLSLLLASGLWADQSPQELFARAGSLYAQERYAEALELYERILREGWEAPELYYNISNCYVRTGNLGYALVMARRAERLDPGDEDIKANLAFVRSLAGQGGPEPKSSRLVAAALAPYRALTANGATIVASAAGFVLAGLISAGMLLERRPRTFGPLTAATAAVLAMSLACLGAKLYEERTQVEAVVVASSTSVRSGPGEEFVVQATLGEGAEVRIKRKAGGWVEISLGPDLTGWVEGADLEEI